MIEEMFYNKTTLIDMDKIMRKDNFKQSMIDCYSNLTNYMPDNGIQVLMFNHTKLDTWIDMLDIVRESGLYITAAYPIEIEKRMKQSKGNYNCVMLIICRKRNFNCNLINKEQLLKKIEELENDLLLSMEEVELCDTDERIFKWVKAIKILSCYTWDFDLRKFFDNITK